MTEPAQEPRRSLKDLRPKEALRGPITRLEPYGAFVDVGAEHDGLLHISRIQEGPVNRIEEVLQPGQDVEVWVSRVDPAANRLELTMRRPVGLEWRDLKPGLRVRGKVVRLEKFGAFVDVGADRPGLIHITEMGAGKKTEPSEVVSIGDEIDVTVLEVDRRKRQIRLSMKDTFTVESDEAEAAPPTAMEIALRRALEGEGERAGGRGGPAGSKRASRRAEQEEILSRTLQNKVRTQAGD